MASDTRHSSSSVSDSPRTRSSTPAAASTARAACWSSPKAAFRLLASVLRRMAKAAFISRRNSFSLFGRTRLFGFLPVEVLILVLGILLAVLVFNYLIPGRRIYLIGANPKVARFSGINIGSNILLTYMFCSTFAFFGAIVLASRVASGRADVAAALVLKSVSAVRKIISGLSRLQAIKRTAARTS